MVQLARGPHKPSHFDIFITEIFTSPTKYTLTNIGTHPANNTAKMGAKDKKKNNDSKKAKKVS